MLKILALCAALFFSVGVPPSSIGVQQFAKLEVAALNHGTQEDIGDGSVYVTLTMLKPNDKTVSHAADYFSMVMPTAYASMVSENWVQTKDGWHIDQWIFELSRSGALTRAEHNVLVEGTGGEIISDDHVDLTAASVNAALNARLEKWYATLK